MENNKSILIIEDDADLIEAMRITLNSHGYEVLAAFHPEEGLRIAKGSKPDLIILDVMFGSDGKTEGFDYSVKLKQDAQLAPIPILMVTSVNIEHPGFHFSEANAGEYLPVDAFIDKPAQPEDLMKKVDELLDRGESKWARWPDA